VIEFDYYIPPDVTINDDGSIDDMSDVYVFDDRRGSFLRSFTGWGMPPIRYITQRGPFQHGQTALDYRLEPRVIQYLHRKTGHCRNDYWDNRSLLINAIRPNRQEANSFEPGRLRKILPGGSIRDLYVFLEMGPAFSPRSNDAWDEYAIEETIRFIAYNPIAFNPDLSSASWGLDSFENLIFYESPDWENRLVFEGDNLDSGGIWFGEDSIGETLNVTYNGTWLAYPTIIIAGPLESPRIFNNTTDEKIQLDYDVDSGETVTINLEYGQKTVVNNSGTNLIGTISTDSDVSTFHIAADPEAAGGVNNLAVFGGGANDTDTSVEVRYYERYIGI
jgi:hypothetical protein